MNNTEQFDEWIRGEMENLDDSPDHFRQADIWQKLQTELHPVPEKKPFFVRRRFVASEVSTYRIAAAAALLLLAGGIWWKIQSTPIPKAVHQAENKLQNSPILQQKRIILAAKNDVKKVATLKKQESFKKQSKEKRPEISLTQVPLVDSEESDNNVGTTTNVARVWNPADVSEVSKNIEIAEVVVVPENPTNQPIVKTAPKPKFKIVHANELVDYQKAELAKVREKEAKAKGFIVINWKANATNQSENSLLTHFKNKSSKAD